MNAEELYFEHEYIAEQTLSKEATDENTVTVISMSRNPRKDEDDTTYYDVISSDNINNFASENTNIENQVVNNILIDSLMNVLNESEREILKYRIGEEQLSFEKIGEKVGLTKQGVQMRFKTIQKKCQRYMEAKGYELCR
jgi:DNA-directed RNA polymerase sigma subunit (sigma70/sigma32)